VAEAAGFALVDPTAAVDLAAKRDLKEEKTCLVISRTDSRGDARSGKLQRLEGRGTTDDSSSSLGPPTDAETPSGAWNCGSGRFHDLPPWSEVAVLHVGYGERKRRRSPTAPWQCQYAWRRPIMSGGGARDETGEGERRAERTRCWQELSTTSHWRRTRSGGTPNKIRPEAD
jgi:hypothetical protein